MIDPTDEGPAGWQIMRLAGVLRSVDSLVVDGLGRLREADPFALAGSDTIEFGPDEISNVKELGHELLELVDQIETLAETLPSAGFSAGYPDIAAAALADLAQGVMAPERALLAARMLSVREGWAGLATSLAYTDTAHGWGAMTAYELLGAFRGARRAAVQRVLAAAGLDDDAEFGTASPQELASLARNLKRFLFE